MIVVLALNSAVDRTLLVPDLQLGHVHRAAGVQVNAGGKGLNVARAVRRLGRPVRVVGFLGGSPAPEIERAVAAEGIEARWVPIAGTTRTCTIVVDADGRATVVNEPGPQVGVTEVRQLEEVLAEALGPDDLLAISGSMPPGVPDDFYARVVAGSPARVIVDVAGAVLRETLKSRAWAAAPNVEEDREAFGPATDVAAARNLARLVDHAFVTQGARGVLYAHGEKVVHLAPPRVQTVNAVGSGDAFVAGVLVGTAEGLSPLDAARLGVAAGAANAARLEPDVGSRDEVLRLWEGVQVTEVPPDRL